MRFPAPFLRHALRQVNLEKRLIRNVTLIRQNPKIIQQSLRQPEHPFRLMSGEEITRTQILRLTKLIRPHALRLLRRPCGALPSRYSWSAAGSTHHSR